MIGYGSAAVGASGLGTTALVLAAAACGGETAPPPDPPASVDVSGAEVVAFEAWPEARELGDGEVLYTGDTVAAGSPVFRAADVLPGPDGDVYVANAGTHEILALDADGDLRWRAGREGEGPAEFSALAGLQGWRGDTVVALDHGDNAASFWTSSGKHGRTVTAGPVPGEPAADLLLSVKGSLVGVLRDGRLVVRGPQRAFGQGRPGLRRARTALTLVDPAGGRRVPVELPGPTVYEHASDGPLPALLAPMSGGTDLTVGPSGDGILLARSGAYEVLELTPDGRARRIHRVEEPRRRVTASLRRAYRRQWSPWFEVDGEIPFPDGVPAFDRIFVAADGSIWARRYHWGERAEEWVRFGRPAGGASIRRLRFPSRVEVLGAAGDAAYGVRRDELDVEHIVRFRLPDAGG